MKSFSPFYDTGVNNFLCIWLGAFLQKQTHTCQEKLQIYYGLRRHRRETTFIFTWATRSFTDRKYTDEASNIAPEEEIMENNYIRW